MGTEISAQELPEEQNLGGTQLALVNEAGEEAAVITSSRRCDLTCLFVTFETNGKKLITYSE